MANYDNRFLGSQEVLQSESIQLFTGLQGQLLLILLASLFQAFLLPFLLEFLQNNNNMRAPVSTQTSTNSPNVDSPETQLRRKILGFCECDEETFCEGGSELSLMSAEPSACITRCLELFGEPELTQVQLQPEVDMLECKCYVGDNCVIKDSSDTPSRVYTINSMEPLCS